MSTEQSTEKTELVPVTNVWTIYREGDDTMAVLARPQDWGNPAKWMYDVYTLEGHGHRNEVHCWLQLLPGEVAGEHILPAVHLEAFSQLIVQILLPGTPLHECNKQYLREDDFWDDAWGKMPPYYEDEDED